jgi:hypothetical protein
MSQAARTEIVRAVNSEKRDGAQIGELQQAASNTTPFPASSARCGVFTSTWP